MEKMARTQLKNGNWKYFYGENAESEANAYEVEMKQKEIEEKERQREIEEEYKAKDTMKNELLNSIKNTVNTLNEAVTKYRKETGSEVNFELINGKLVVNSINSEAFSKYYSVCLENLIDQLFSK